MLLLILTLYAKQRGIFQAVPRHARALENRMISGVEERESLVCNFPMQNREREREREIVQYSAKLNVSERAILFDVPISIKAGNMIHAVVAVVR